MGERDALVRGWILQQWLEVSGQWGTANVAQDCKSINGPAGWLQYVSKHAARGAKMYQRRGGVPGWDSMPKVWSKGGEWPTPEPLAIALTSDQARRYRRRVRAYVVAQRRAEALQYEARGEAAKAAGAWKSVAYLRRSLKCNDRNLSSVRGIGEWCPQDVVLRLAESVGWDGVLV